MIDPLGGITEADFLAWKHHPVTKVWLQFMADRGQQLAREQIDLLRTSVVAPDAFFLGEFKGRIGELADLTAPQFQSVVEFYQSTEPTPQEDADAA